jgi:hypothetical protein
MNSTGPFVTRSGGAVAAGLLLLLSFVPAHADEAELLRSISGPGASVDYTKLDAAGQPLEDQGSIYTIEPWTCVRDNVTNLVWEVKTIDGGLRDQGHTYSWHNPDPQQNGGAPGTRNGGDCAGGAACDTHAYVAAVNEEGLCGHSDWRMPTRNELRSIVDYRASFPAIDANHFPNTVALSYWSADPNPTYPAYAWHTDFRFGLANYYYFKNGPKPVRLVRDVD